jgi:MFS family permease
VYARVCIFECVPEMTDIGFPLVGFSENNLASSFSSPQPHSDNMMMETSLRSKNRSLCSLCSLIWTPLRHWLLHSAWPGMGLFGESYILFSIGTLTPLWKVIYPECFDNTVCSPQLLYSLTYSVVVGVMVGMIVIGRCANTIGRRKGSLLTATLMCGGAWSMVVQSIWWSSQESVVILFRSTAISLFVFGIGVGGEYPLSCSLATENSTTPSNTDKQTQPTGTLRCNSQETSTNDKHVPLTMDNSSSTEPSYRGRQIQLVFAMQGVGIWFNSLTLVILLLVLGQTSSDRYQATTLLIIWRITYIIGALILLIVLVTRFLFLKESKVWEQDHTQQSTLVVLDHVQPSSSSCSVTQKCTTDFNTEIEAATPDRSTTGSSVSELSNPTVVVVQPQDQDDDLDVPMTGETETISIIYRNNHDDPAYSTSLWYNYGGRLFGASMAWLLWDISFYGNKLFQATFLLALTGQDTTLLEFAVAATLNSTVALLGYFGAAMLLDKPNFGRVKLQCMGFLITGGLFVTCGLAYESLPNGWLVGLYLACSFVGQLGPNATTFLIPGEVFPTEQRTYCHGICAASGKAGALIAAILFHFIPRDADLFLLCGYTSFAGYIVTYYFIPETSGLDLMEVDKKWHMIRQGRRYEYHGPANHSQYLSVFESPKASVCTVYR